MKLKWGKRKDIELSYWIVWVMLGIMTVIFILKKGG